MEWQPGLLALLLCRSYDRLGRTLALPPSPSHPRPPTLAFPVCRPAREDPRPPISDRHRSHDAPLADQPYFHLLARLEAGGAGGDYGYSVGADHGGDHGGDAGDRFGMGESVPLREEDADVVLAAVG